MVNRRDHEHALFCSSHFYRCLPSTLLYLSKETRNAVSKPPRCTGKADRHLVLQQRALTLPVKEKGKKEKKRNSWRTRHTDGYSRATVFWRATQKGAKPGPLPPLLLNALCRHHHPPSPSPPPASLLSALLLFSFFLFLLGASRTSGGGGFSTDR